MAALPAAQAGAAAGDVAGVRHALEEITSALVAMQVSCAGTAGPPSLLLAEHRESWCTSRTAHRVDCASTTRSLRGVASPRLQATLGRMGEKCDPYI